MHTNMLLGTPYAEGGTREVQNTKGRRKERERARGRIKEKKEIDKYFIGLFLLHLLLCLCSLYNLFSLGFIFFALR